MDNSKDEKINKGINARLISITIKAVVVKDDKVLLLRRSKSDSLNPSLLDFPGGHLEKGELIEQALEREIREEIGIEVEPGSIIRVDQFLDDQEQFSSEKIGLRCIVYYKSGEVSLSHEHEDFYWLTIDEAMSMLTNDGFEGEKKATLQVAKEYLEMKNALAGWQRVLADFENYKKRTQVANEEFKKYCMEDFVTQLLPVLDNFEMATEHIPDENKNDGWVTGVMHIKNQLESVLRDRGIREIEAKPGDKLDEQIHEVISGNSSENGEVKIKKVLKKGYRIGDRVIRPAGVEAE